MDSSILLPPVGDSQRPVSSVYVHIPFCAQRCGYCNFTVAVGAEALVPRYLQAIERELVALPRAPLRTLFFGGGTPTQLPAAEFKQLSELLWKYFERGPGCEWTVEANPGDLTPNYLSLLQRLGVNRISLGAQSFTAGHLVTLERNHTPDQVRQAVAGAEQFAAVSLDLIFGVPGQSLAEWDAELEQALQLRPRHLSTYGLTFEKGTTFWNRWQRGVLQPVPEEVERDQYELAIERLTAAGYQHYEISNFALPGFACRHNENYWLGGNYHGLGPGAARHVDGFRGVNHRGLLGYLKRSEQQQNPLVEQEVLDPVARARERLVFGLRRLEGLRVSHFWAETGFDLWQLGGSPLAKFLQAGYLELKQDQLKLTRAGLMISDSLWPDLIV